MVSSSFRLTLRLDVAGACDGKVELKLAWKQETGRCLPFTC
jgi:hypothetical protein